MRNYKVDYTRYSFRDNDDWGDYDNGKRREPWFDNNGYSKLNYLCTDGKWHTFDEHRAKWEFFNGDIPESYQIDHIIPIKNGGTNKLSNLRLVTPNENSNNPISRENQRLAKLKMWENEEYRTKLLDIHSSEAYKRKQSESHKGKKGYINKEKCRKVYQYKDNILVCVYDSLCDAARKSGFNKERIMVHCNDRKEYKGYKWGYTPL